MVLVQKDMEVVLFFAFFDDTMRMKNKNIKEENERWNVREF